MSDDTFRFETRAIHAGQDPDVPFGSVNVPIYQTATYVQPAVGEPKVWDYARGATPRARRSSRRWRRSKAPSGGSRSRADSAPKPRCC